MVYLIDFVNAPKLGLKEAGYLRDPFDEMIQNRSPIFWLNGQRA